MKRKNKRIPTRFNQVDAGNKQKAFILVVVVIFGNSTKDMCDTDENEKELFSSSALCLSLLFFLLLLATRVRAGTRKRKCVKQAEKKTTRLSIK